MRNRKGYTRQTIEFSNGRGTREVLVSDDCPHLGVAEAEGDPGMYWVYHLPSQNLACIVKGQEIALELVASLGEVPDLEQRIPSPQALNLAVARIKMYRPTPKPRRKRAVPDVPPLELEPYYPSRTPSVEVRAADRRLAGALMAGQPYGELAERAGEVAWWESVMARVGHVLLEGDVPKRAPIRLRDGTPCTWEGFKVSFRKLNEYGDQLLDLSKQLQNLFPWAEEADWPHEAEARFEAIDEQFKGVVCAAWMEWAICVSHFIASPPVRQQQVRDRLGFIGNEERGWHELGMKTFMRHPEILEACKLRRIGRVRVMGALAL